MIYNKNNETLRVFNLIILKFKDIFTNIENIINILEN